MERTELVAVVMEAAAAATAVVVVMMVVSQSRGVQISLGLFSMKIGRFARRNIVAYHYYHLRHRTIFFLCRYKEFTKLLLLYVCVISVYSRSSHSVHA